MIITLKDELNTPAGSPHVFFCGLHACSRVSQSTFFFTTIFYLFFFKQEFTSVVCVLGGVRFQNWPAVVGDSSLVPSEQCRPDVVDLPH